MFFFLIFITSETSKYLYIGKENCVAEGNIAYLDNPIDDESFLLCANTIPRVSPNDIFSFNPNEVELIVIVVEAGQYSGLENLNNYKKVTLQKKNIDNIDVKLSMSQLDAAFSINYLTISNGINVELNGESLASQQNHIINYITLDGTNAHAKTIQIQIQKLIINLDTDLILDNTILNVNTAQIQFNGPYTITDNLQILNAKVVSLDETNLEYNGENGYNILILSYHGQEKIRRKQETGPKLIIDSVLMNLNKNVKITEFIDAELSSIFVSSENNAMFTLTIDTPSNIYFPVKSVFNSIIRSDGKVNVKDESVLRVNDFIDTSIFSGKGKDGEQINVFYQINSENVCNAYLFNNDIEFKKNFLDFPIKGLVSKDFDEITIHNSHLKGCTILNNLNIVLGDTNSKIDAILLQGTGKILDSNKNEQNPEYFKITKKETLYELTPMKADVTNYNDLSFVTINNQLSLKHFDGKETTFYKFNFDIQADSIIFDENIKVQFDCNIISRNKLQIPELSSIINSPESGVIALLSPDYFSLNTLSSKYSKKFNRIYISNNYDWINNTKIKIYDILGSQNDELNEFNFHFGFDETANIEDHDNININLLSIEAPRGISIEFDAKSVMVNENCIKIDKKTLLPNPRFSAALEFQMGQLKENCDIYIKKRLIAYNEIPAGEYSKLYLEGNVKLSVSEYKNDLIVSDLLYINGLLNADENLVIKTYNLILNLNKEGVNIIPEITIQNTLYTNMISSFSSIENIKSQKIVLTGIDSNQDITINGKNIKLQKDKTNYELNTAKYSKMILYLPYVEASAASLLNENGNIINLKIENSNENPRVLDFNIINNDYNDHNKQALLKIVVDDSIKTAKPKFDGEFGYAFDDGLNEKILYKEGINGNEVEQNPDYLPIKKVEMEPFALKEDFNPTDSVIDITSNEMITEITSSSDIDVENNDKDKLSTGAKVGIAAASVASVIGIGAGIGIPIHKSKQRKKESEGETEIDQSFI